jgi:hypothetical protein
MALFKPIKDISENLANVAKTEGQFLIATDTGEAFVDVSGTSRKRIAEASYTFIVDSNEALAAWANNEEGNDYSQVLIKKGTWTSDIEVNLTTAGTKVVVGQAGSLLSFTSEYGLKYTTRPTTAEYWMLGVNVAVDIVSENSVKMSYAFSNCTNLTDCNGDGKSIGFGNDSAVFIGCTNLTNCNGTSIGIFNSVIGPSTNYSFSNCSNLSNCTGTGTGNGNGNGYGFSNCSNLSNCTGTGDGNSDVSSFGFNNCGNIISCIGNSCSGKGATFINCRIMSFNRPGGMNTAATVYSMCYMKNNQTVSVDDTAAGGWNRS